MLPQWPGIKGHRAIDPRPVPELEAPAPPSGHRLRYSLAVRSATVGLVAVAGIAVSGAVTLSNPAASKAPARPGPHPVRLPSPGAHPGPTTTTTRAPAPAAVLPTTTAPTPLATQSTVSPAPTTVPPSTTTPVATRSTDSLAIQVSGSHLVLNGAPYRFTGVNAYEAATSWGTNAGCGAMLSDAQLNQLFSELAPNSLVRIGGFQATMATNLHTHQLDWGPLDRVFAAAASHGQRIILTIAGQSGVCDNLHWSDPSWYDGGFMNVFNDPSTTSGQGLTPLSYWSFLQDVVNRYKSSPALGMWEPMSEAEASTCPPQYQPVSCGGHQTCPNEVVAAAALRHFFDAVGAEIHSLDPSHLVESGLLGGGQCGTQGADFQYVSASPGIDVLSYHDYWGQSPIGGDQWNGMAVRLNQAAALGKPIIAGETGLMAGSAPGCLSLPARNSLISAKEKAQLQAGSSGLLVWNWVPSTTGACSYAVGPTDPLLQPGGAIG
jgi:mannan endo-1,4-beta-mannosidase